VFVVDRHLLPRNRTRAIKKHRHSRVKLEVSENDQPVVAFGFLSAFAAEQAVEDA
jgi:hypothetical protein